MINKKLVLNYNSLFPIRETEVISNTVNLFWFNKRHSISRCYTYVDLMQEAVIAWWKAKEKLRVSKKMIIPSPSTIVKNRLLDILKKSNAQKRAEELYAIPLDDLFEEGDDE